ncbi:MAG: HD domain-containing protein [Lachnospiraceae bacterium]|nr:HD domain-containing protein [Lachnospiraceae bacterium]
MNEIIRMNENTWRIEDGMVRMFLLTGTKEALLVDSGVSASNAKEIAESITDLPVKLINTHADRDHIAGNNAFEFVYMGAKETALYRANGGSGTVVPVQQGDIIDLGDRPLEIIDLPGHTPGSIAILDVKNRVLIGGDSIQDGRIFMFGEHRNLSDYITSLVKLSAYEGRFDTVYASHSSVEVAPDIIPKLIAGAKQILAGEATGEEIDMFGNSVLLYQFDFAGFLCPKISYETLFAYVKDALAAYDHHGGVSKNRIKYSRFEHTERVYRWAMILSEDFTDKIDMEALRIATIFHDIGYSSNKENMHSHAADGAVLCREYLDSIGYPEEKAEFICDLIARHSDKEELHREDAPLELVLLMEADLFDDTGAHGIVMDAWIQATKEDVSFESILEHIKKFSWKQMQVNPMRTEKARRIWEEKKELTNKFVESLSVDLYGESL